MKKILSAFFIIIFLTGCDKALKCERKVDSDTITVGEVQKIYSDGDSITKIESTKTFNIKEDSLKENFPNLFGIMKSDYSSKNIEFTEKVKGDNYELKLVFNPSEYDDEILTDLSLSKSLTGHKKILEEQGFTCK